MQLSSSKKIQVSAEEMRERGHVSEFLSCQQIVVGGGVQVDGVGDHLDLAEALPLWIRIHSERVISYRA
jgi:hypothetical protein